MQLSTFQWRLHILLSVFYFLAILYFVSAPVAVYGAPPVDYQGNPCELDAVYTERAPKIDGYIDKDLWSRGALATNFTQREPETGERVSERTGVRILYDDDNLYLLFICGDIEPDQMVANIMRRDQSLYQDDNVEIFLDPLHDHRTIFLFATNPLGARRDAIVTAEGRNFNDDWDGIWEVKTQVSTQGWVAEMKIPLETLRFVSGENMTWGLNFGRALQRDGEYAFWSPIRYTPSYRERYRAEHYGHLNGLRLTGSTKTLQIKPYAISGGDKDYVEENDWNFERDAGLDVKYGVTNQLTLDLTYNTDFAQVEADNEVVNLTRFNLFFPEKRDFFLEGAGLFNLSSQGATSSSTSGAARDMVLFHSRSIGLYNRQPVPLYGGMRLHGKVGDYDVGVLNITSKEKVFTASDGTDDVSPRTNYSVIRARRNFGNRSDVGFMATNMTNGEMQDDNKAIGFDTNLFFPKDFAFSGYYGRTFTPGLKGSANSMFGSFGKRGKLFSGYVNGLRIEKNFNPQMGFIERDDINVLSSMFSVSPRPRKWGIKSFTNRFSYRYVTDQGFSKLEHRYRLMNVIQTESNDNIEAYIYQSQVYLPKETKITGIKVPVDTYKIVRYSISFSGDRSRAISLGSSVRGGDYYNGFLNAGTVSASFNLFNRMQTYIGNTYSRMKLSGVTLNTNTLRHYLTFSFTPDLFVRSVTQWNNRVDRIYMNVMMRYTYKPGSDIYLVYNDTYGTEEWMPAIRQRTALLKVSYMF